MQKLVSHRSMLVALAVLIGVVALLSRMHARAHVEHGSTDAIAADRLPTQGPRTSSPLPPSLPIESGIESGSKPRYTAETEPLNIELPPGPYRDAIPNLRAAADAGNAEAAYLLARELMDCYLFPRSKPNTYAPEMAELCTGVDVRDPYEVEQRLQQAADAGLLAAQILYPTAVSLLMSPTDMIRDPESVVRYKERSMAYLNAAAGNGSPEAMLDLSSAYGHGVLAEKNLLLAYAYQYAADLVSPSPSGNDPEWLYGGQFTDEQKAAAHAMAEKIYQQCCR